MCSLMGRSLRRGSLVLLALVFVAAAIPTSALADGYCDARYETCSVVVDTGGTGTGTGTGGTGTGTGTGGTGTGTGAGGTGTGGGGTVDPCADEQSAQCVAIRKAATCASLQSQLAAGGDATSLNYLLSANGCPPPAPPGTGGAGPAAPPPPAAIDLAQLAKASFKLPKPTGHRSPGETQLIDGWPFSWVNLWTYYWTDPATWQPLTATAEAGGVSATVTATPTGLSFNPGDGGQTVTCAGPGRPWVDSDGNEPPTAGACGYQYTRASSGPITSTTTITWQVSWSGSDGTGGQLAGMSTSTSGQLRILQIQTVTVPR